MDLVLLVWLMFAQSIFARQGLLMTFSAPFEVWQIFENKKTPQSDCLGQGSSMNAKKPTELEVSRQFAEEL